MAFCKTVIHVAQPGDTFYRLAQRYKTTVPEIIMRNPGVNPYNLQVGTRLNICAGQDTNPVQRDEMELNNDMRKAWTQQLYWSSILMNSIFQDQADTEDIAVRFMQTPEDIASVFSKFYPQSTVNQLTQLFVENNQLAIEAMRAMKANDMQKVDQIEQQWYLNAERIARLLSSINSTYSYEEIRDALVSYIEMQLRQMQAALMGNYSEAIRLFDENENKTMELADYLTEGLIDQFYKS